MFAKIKIHAALTIKIIRSLKLRQKKIISGKIFEKIWRLIDYITHYSILRGTNRYIVIMRLRLGIFSS